MSAVVVPIRWLNHGRDICATVTSSEVRWIMRDVACAVYGDPRDFSGDPSHEQTLRDHGTATAWTIAIAGRWIAQQASAMESHSELKQWLEDQEASLYRQGLANVVRLTSAPVAIVNDAGVLVAAPELYSVRQAAEILDRDPAISTGQNRLFDVMLRSGWTIRTGDSHRPSAESIRLGFLGTAHRQIPAHDELYPQLVVTADGIRELHRILHGQTTPRFTAPTPTPALTEAPE